MPAVEKMHHEGDYGRQPRAILPPRILPPFQLEPDDHYADSLGGLVSLLVMEDDDEPRPSNDALRITLSLIKGAYKELFKAGFGFPLASYSVSDCGGISTTWRKEGLTVLLMVPSQPDGLLYISDIKHGKSNIDRNATGGRLASSLKNFVMFERS